MEKVLKNMHCSLVNEVHGFNRPVSANFWFSESVIHARFYTEVLNFLVLH